MSTIRRINPPELSKPAGYSHIAEVTGGRLAFISGQIAFDRGGNLVGAGDLAAQTVQVFENLKAALAALGADFTHVAKITYFVRDATQAPIVREVRARYLDAAAPPASTFVEVSRLVRDDLLIEVEAVAALP